jgi:predicted nucleic acid-binding protein
MKTYVFDASALFALLHDKPGAAKVEDLLKEARRARARVLMSAVNYGEVYGLMLRESSAEQALSVLHAIAPLPIELVDATAQRACNAADLKSEYKLYFVDSFAAALAVEYKATLVTSDSDFRRLGHSFPIVWLKA